MGPRAAMVALAAAGVCGAQAMPAVEEVMRRVAEEAEVFQQMAKDMIAEETLTHRWLKAPPRFQPRVGAAALEPVKLRMESREVTSEYTFGTMEEAPNQIHEFRKVTAVDGRPVLAKEQARRTLSLNLRSRSDRVKKQLLKDFERYGVSESATDVGQMVLMFTKRRLAGFQFTLEGVSQMGTDPVFVVGYREQGRESLTVFEGHNTLHQAMAGQIWVRQRDFLPLKMTLIASRPFKPDLPIQTEATVEYQQTSHGVVMPASITLREQVGDKLLVENLYRYGPFRRFAAAADIKFEIEEPPPAQGPKP